MSKKKQRDHIDIPRNILVEFVDGNDNKVNVLNLKTNKIERVITNNMVYFTKINYYNENVDNFIKENVETIMGKIRKCFKKKMDKIYKINFDEGYLKAMKNIFLVQYFRGRYFVNAMKMSKQKHNEFLDDFIKYVKSQRCENEFNEIFFQLMDNVGKNLVPSFLKIENTDRTFIMPFSQMYFIKIKTYYSYIFPISPDIALIWKWGSNEDRNFRIMEGKKAKKAIEKMNDLCIKKELEHNTDCMVIGKRDELDRIIAQNKD